MNRELQWGLGNHNLHNIEPNLIPDLALIHLHKIDYDVCYGLNLRNINEGRRPIGGGYQNFYLGKQFNNWWLEAENRACLMPQALKNTNLF